MRALCEACARPQPVDWKPGGICIHCGQAVRREARCFWCVKWTPAAGKYCRTCAAAVVEDRLFGAARMLKDAGVDRFGVPKMLADLDLEQIENFTNIYQRHAAAMNRHVDHVRFLETFLQHKGWSERLEDELIAELPWPEERLKELSPPLDPAEFPVAGRRSRAECLAYARAIASVSPLLLTRTLVPLVRLMLEDWQVHRDAHNTVFTSDPLMKGEAALALTDWRVVYGPGILADRYVLIDALRVCPFKFPSALHLALMGDEGAQVPPEALVSDDPDVAFTAALASGDIGRLIAAERDSDPLKRYVAAYRLIKLGEFTGVGEVLRQAGAAHQLDLLRQVGYEKKPAPALREVFYELLESSPEREIRDAASDRIRQCWQPGDTMRIARHAQGDSRVYQGLLQTSTIPPEELVLLCEHLLHEGKFRVDQWGMPDVAKEGRLPPSFVPLHWPNANEATRVEMCKFAETQLENYADENLHRFLVSIVFGNDEFAVLQQAWTSLYRWYGRSDHTRMGPLRIEAESLQRFFGSVLAFVPILTRFLGNGLAGPILHDLFAREPLAKLLRYADPNVLPYLKRALRPTLELAGALKGVMKQERCDLMLRLACIDLLAMFAMAPELRPPVVGILEEFRGTDLDHGAAMGLQRIAGY
jgi:hypothetical protein